MNWVNWVNQMNRVNWLYRIHWVNQVNQVNSVNKVNKLDRVNSKMYDTCGLSSKLTKAWTYNWSAYLMSHLLIFCFIV